MIFPVAPSIISNGEKAATVVATAKNTGIIISCVPSMTARSLGFPCSYWEKMFSPTTMASSTTIPSTTMKANREMRLMETSRWGQCQKAAHKRNGDAQADPERQADPQKQRQSQNHQRQPRQAVLDQ